MSLAKISHGVYPEYFEGFEMTNRFIPCYSESFGETQDNLREESFVMLRLVADSQ